MKLYMQHVAMSVGAAVVTELVDTFGFMLMAGRINHITTWMSTVFALSTARFASLVWISLQWKAESLLADAHI